MELNATTLAPAPNLTSDDLQGHGKGQGQEEPYDGHDMRVDFVFEFIVPGVLLNGIGILGLVGK